AAEARRHDYGDCVSRTDVSVPRGGAGCGTRPSQHGPRHCVGAGRAVEHGRSVLYAAAAAKDRTRAAGPVGQAIRERESSHGLGESARSGAKDAAGAGLHDTGVGRGQRLAVRLQVVALRMQRTAYSVVPAVSAQMPLRITSATLSHSRPSAWPWRPISLNVAPHTGNQNTYDGVTTKQIDDSRHKELRYQPLQHFSCRVRRDQQRRGIYTGCRDAISKEKQATNIRGNWNTQRHQQGSQRVVQ